MSRDRFDLHVHSSASDGMLRPREVVALAAERGLGGVAITDHDTIAGLGEARGMAEALGLRLLSGVEMTCMSPMAPDVHVLGYGIEPEHAGLAEVFAELRGYRAARVARMVTRLQQLGARVTLADVEAISAGAPLARPHVARALVQAEVVPDIEAAFTHAWIGVGGRAYLPRQGVSIERAVGAIHDAHGIAVLAHPGDRDTLPVMEELVRFAASCGIDGIEVDHPSHDGDVVRRLAELASEMRLVQTAGSDDHASGVDGSRLGCRTVPRRIVDAIDARLRARRGAPGPAGQ